jgi:alkaline phosphatase D
MLAALASFVLLQAVPISVIAMGSCLDEEKDQTKIWNAVLTQKPDAFLFLGDNIYADEPEDKAAAYAKLAAQPGFQRLKREVPRIWATWDDHDYGMNDAGAEYANKELAQRQFLDFWGDGPDSPRRKRPGVYDSAIVGPEGQRVQIILLDTRTFRSPLNRERNVDGQYNRYRPTQRGTLLGEAQWDWLEQELKKPAELRIIATSIQIVAQDHWFEKWANLPAERQRMFDLIRNTGAKGVVFVSGDRHLAELSMTHENVPYPMYDLTASAMTQSSARWRPLEENRHRVATMNVGNNFGILRIAWGASPMVTFEIRDEDAELTIRHTVPLSLLQPR